ncbi:exopolysaccharide biosynthesis protein [Belnapia rosea]|uniref:Uncharacterized conserved protein n=1 Tax=Belnapia rosea TaxID=938405 RepID=A0A1G7E2Q8_9PROT|nr:exopolysaccharide biosynthesis protein [Belnapia rosea]SDE57790.1 Uncharacterized conserved protein [Belnapia rosea]
MNAHFPGSVVLEELVRDIRAGEVTLESLVDGTGDRSFGLILLLLALLGLAPGTSTLAGLLLIVPALQMALVHPRPALPRHIAHRQVKPQHLAWTAGWAVPTLRCLERLSRPRWLTVQEAVRRLVGVTVLLLGALLLVPVPLSNILPGLDLVLIACACLQRDGLLLCLGLLAALVLLGAASAVAWRAAGIALSCWVA